MKNVLLISILMFSGCINIAQHVKHGHKIINTYNATSVVYENCIKAWSINEFHSMYPEFTKNIQILYPLWVVDFCGEIVFDTLTYPYDFNNHLKHEEELRKNRIKKYLIK